jgi:hypothetical protein
MGSELRSEPSQRRHKGVTPAVTRNPVLRVQAGEGGCSRKSIPPKTAKNRSPLGRCPRKIKEIAEADALHVHSQSANRREMPKEAPQSSLSSAVAHSFQNRVEVLSSEQCVCFHCFARFAPTEIMRWCDSDDPGEGDHGPDLERYPGQTAACPFCEIDSVIGSASGLSLTDEFLRSLREYWHVTKHTQ